MRMPNKTLHPTLINRAAKEIGYQAGAAEAPVADFSVDQDTGVAPLPVRFNAENSFDLVDPDIGRERGSRYSAGAAKPRANTVS